MVKLDNPVWKTLHSAGNDVNKQLQALLEGDGDSYETIEALAEGLSHQLSWYSATAYVLPHLAALFPSLSKEEQMFLVGRMGAAIAAEADCPLTPGTEAHSEFCEGLDSLRRQITPLLTDAGLHALLQEDEELGLMFCLGALAILGDRNHAYGLWYLSGSSWEEGPGACSCGWYDELLPLIEQPDCIQPAEIAAWDKQSLDEESVWLDGLLKAAGDEMVRPILPLLYGTGTCPDCGEQEPYWAWMNRYWEEC